MLRTSYDIIDEVLVRANVTTTAAGGLYTEAILKEWLDNSHRSCAGYRKWPFTEGRASTTFAGTEEVGYFENWKTDSVRYLEIGGLGYRKVRFPDYKKYKENYSDGEDRVFTDYGRLLYVNVSAGGSGTLQAWGQYTPAGFDLTDNIALTVFSDQEEEGNEAMVEEMLSYAKRREGKHDEALVHHTSAVAILDRMWDRLTEEQTGYHPQDSGMWERIDVLTGAPFDDMDENRFY
jgi:hypothetical protein